jgi:hypothetical protein
MFVGTLGTSLCIPLLTVCRLLLCRIIELAPAAASHLFAVLIEIFPHWRQDVINQKVNPGSFRLARRLRGWALITISGFNDL